MKCIKCDSEMVDAKITGNGLYSLILMNKTKSIWDEERKCSVLCYVCPQCGYIELYAENPKEIKQK